MVASQSYVQTPGHVIAAGMVLSLVDVIAIGLRFFARKRQKQPLKADDWFMAIATLLTLVIGSTLVWGVSKRGLAYHMEFPEGFNGNPLALVTDQMSATLMSQAIFVIAVPLALGFIKLSILLFYFRIFAITTASLTYILLAIFTVFTAAWTLAFFLASVLQCKGDLWALTSSTMDISTHCPGTTHIAFSLALTDFITDVIIICIPFPLIWRIKLSTVNKLTASAVFLFGSVTIIASLIRLISMIRLLNAGFDPNLDGILLITEYLYWGMIEAGTGVFAGCLPTFQVLIRKLPWDNVMRPFTRLSDSLSSTLNLKSSRSHGTTGYSGSDSQGTKTGGASASVSSRGKSETDSERHIVRCHECGSESAPSSIVKSYEVVVEMNRVDSHRNEKVDV